MKTKFLLSIILFFLLSISLRAQKENNVWCFGDSIGADFNLGSPVMIKTKMRAYEGCASICDSSGKLLFYSNGQQVWDNSHSVMPNGSGLLGHYTLSATQGVAILPLFDNPNQYLLFTVQEYPRPKEAYLRYSLIDMTLNGGKGDIVSSKKNIKLDSNMSEKMITIPTKGAVWLLTHTLDSSSFHAYKISSATSLPAPIISTTTGPAYTPGLNYYYLGEMKVSTDFKKIALANHFVSPWTWLHLPMEVYLYDFDDATGRLSGTLLLDTLENVYSVEFSPDNTKLYVEDYSNVFQYNLSLLPSISAVRSSKYTVANHYWLYGMRRGPDNKIYVRSQNNKTTISVINQPNKLGSLCDYQDSVATFKRSEIITYIGLGNYSYPPKPLITILTHDTVVCEGTKISYPFDISFKSFLWNDGDTSRIKILSAGGKYWRVSTKGFEKIIDTFVITYKTSDTLYSRTDNTICENDSILITTDSNRSNILWQDGTTTKNKTIKNTGIYWRSSISDCNYFIDTFNIKFNKIDTNFHLKIDTVLCFDEEIILHTPQGFTKYAWSDGETSIYRSENNNKILWLYSSGDDCRIRVDTFKIRKFDFELNIPDTSICPNEKILLDGYISSTARYLWSDGGKDRYFKNIELGKFWLNVTEDKCSITDTFMIKPKIPILNIGNDTLLCKGDVLKIKTNIDDAIYLWKDGSSYPYYIAKDSGIYYVKVLKNNCEVFDSIKIDYVKCNDCISIPNAFTPNGDGKNDFFKLFISCPTEFFDMIIVNRYGEQIFKSNNPNINWDGRYNEKEQELGVFYYLIKVKFNYPNAVEEIIKGDISLIR